MRAYVDCVLALLPFEPEAHARLGGPRCVYVAILWSSGSPSCGQAPRRR